MSTQSSIEWTEATWNPVTGCTKVSTGCKFCYAERLAKRLQAMGQPRYARGFQVALHEDALEAPLGWKKPRRIFVNSMSDLFHPEVPEAFIYNIFEVMRKADWHQFQVLTKRSERLLQMSDTLDWPGNVWMGVSVENQEQKVRIDHLRQTSAFIKFLSLEPLLGPLFQMNLDDMDWVIVGGESGPGARLMAEEWVLDIKKQCEKTQVSFFFKQWGGVNKKKTGRVLLGTTWDEMPSLQARNPLLISASI